MVDKNIIDRMFIVFNQQSRYATSTSKSELFINNFKMILLLGNYLYNFNFSHVGIQLLFLY